MPENRKLLLIEDELNVGSTLTEILRSEGYWLAWAKNLAEAEQIFTTHHFDLALVDVGLPDGSGFDFAMRLRQSTPKTAIVFLTAWSSPENRIQGLELGAEDYVTKPFHLKELLLRIKNVLKRADLLHSSLSSATIGRAEVFFPRFEARVGDCLFSLSHKECALLQFFFEHRGTVIRRNEILDRVWGEEAFPTERTVDNFVLKLRKIVEHDPEHPQVIKSIRGVGYQLL